MNLIVNGLVEIELTDPKGICGISTEPSPAKHFPLGTRVITPDGKQWTYFKAGADINVGPAGVLIKESSLTLYGQGLKE